MEKEEATQKMPHNVQNVWNFTGWGFESAFYGYDDSQTSVKPVIFR